MVEITQLARDAMRDTDVARTGVTNPCNGSAPYSWVIFHGQRVVFNDGEFTIEQHRDAGTSKAATYADTINTALLELSITAVKAGMIEGARLALEAAANGLQAYAEGYTARKVAAAKNKQRVEVRDFETMAMACAFRSIEIRNLDPATIVEKAGD